MAERPILFSGPLVKAIIAGRKTETRRLVTKGTSVAPKTVWSHTGDEVISVPGWANLDLDAPATKAKGCRGRYCTSWVDGDAAGGGQYLHVPAMDHETRHRVRARIAPGDTLYVREAWALHFLFKTLSPRDARMEDPDSVFYRADGEDACSRPVPIRPEGSKRTDITDSRCTPSQREDRWRPSIHMPKWASRIRLRVTEVCAERLQAITEVGAKSEGIEPQSRGMTPSEFANRKDSFENGGDRGHIDEYLPAFEKLWGDINAGREGAAWSDDPWVWVYKFEVRT